MKRYTLLQMIQEVAASLNADEITTLDESIEAVDIKRVVLQALESISTRREWYWRQHKLRAGTIPSAGSLRVVMNLPSDCDTIEEIKYQSSADVSSLLSYKPLTYLFPEEFLALVASRNPTDPNVDTIATLPDSRPIYIYNNKAPQYYTQFAEGQIVCDSYNQDVDPTGIDAAKTMVLCTVNIDTSGATLASWVPDIPTRFFPLWLAESIAAASVLLRQMDNGRAEREARRLMIDLTEFNEQALAARTDQGVNYARRYSH